MSGDLRRHWGVYIFRNLIGAPMLSLGVHVDIHTPRVDFHALIWTICIGRMVWQPSRRLVYFRGERRLGHMDDCRCRP